MTQPLKNWKPGVADEVWKTMICARDAERADDLMAGLVYVLVSAGADTERGLAVIGSMSGEQIVAALKAYKASAYRSVQSALVKKEAAE